MERSRNLIFSEAMQQEMLDLPDGPAAEADDFMVRLGKNPYSPALLAGSKDCGGGLMQRQLPSGCIVSWQVITQPPFTRHPRLGLMQPQIVKIVGVDYLPR